MKTLRSMLFWCHLAAGTAAGAIILIMCVTGALLALKPQILNRVDRDVRFVRAQSSPRLTASQLLAAAAESRRGAAPVSVAVDRDPEAAVAIGFGRDDTTYVDPYSGRVLGNGSVRAAAFFRSLEDWHRWLAASGESRATARSITGASTLAFFGLALSGLFLWWPRKWLPQHLHAILTFRRGASGRARDFNWHNVIGFWCAPVIVIMAGTGTIMSYPWANNLLYRAMGSTPPAVNQGNANPGAPANQQNGRGGGRGTKFDVMPLVDRSWTRAEAQMPTWRTITMRLPARGSAPFAFTFTDGRSWNAFARSQLTIEAATGAVVQWQPYEAQSLGQKARGWARFAHTGELGGPATEVIAGIACLGGVMLVWTGLALVVRRVLGLVYRPKVKLGRAGIGGMVVELGVTGKSSR